MSGCGGGCTQTGRPQGPTDETLRCSGCAWLEQIGVGGLSIHGRQVPGFALGAAAPVDIFNSLTLTQQAWVISALNAWMASTAVTTWMAAPTSTCPQLTPIPAGTITNTGVLTAAIGCFQAWFNAQNAQGGTITSGGTFDQTTAAALMAAMVQAAYTTAAGTPVGLCPANCGIQTATTATATSSSTGYYVAGGLAIVVVGGLIYVLSRKKGA
jgi:hypothetical protein